MPSLLRNLILRIGTVINFVAIIMFSFQMIYCKGTETMGREPAKYKKNVEVTYILDRDLLEDQNADFPTVYLVCDVYNPERLPDGRGLLYDVEAVVLEKINMNTYQGYIPQILIQTEILSNKHQATVWIPRWGEIPTGENIIIDGAYDIEVTPLTMRFRIK